MFRPTAAPTAKRKSVAVSWWQKRMRQKKPVRRSRVRKVSSSGNQPAMNPVSDSAKQRIAVMRTVTLQAPNHGAEAAAK